MTAATFAELTKTGVEQFLQTVLVIDNELTLDAGQSKTIPTLIRPNVSLKSTASGTPQAVEPPLQIAAQKAVPEPPTLQENLTSASSPPENPLDAKEIMDAFLKRSMICGMHKPNKGDELVAQAITAARRSDAVIIDWLLDGADPSAAKGIIGGIIKGDLEENGRLRLLVVYTSEQDVADVEKQIREHLGWNNQPSGVLGVIQDRNARIVVLNKEGTVGGGRQVSVADLPKRLIEEFAYLTVGVLSTFAVTAIAAVRREIHHVLAIFSKELDGAFLGHMCALPSPEDAREFALDLLAGELRSVASMNPETIAVLSPENLGLHVDSLGDGEHLTLGNVQVATAIARSFPSGGLDALVASHAQQKIVGTTNVPSKSDAVTHKNVGFLFHKGEGSAEDAHYRFARFAAFRTELFDRTKLPQAWKPTLMLGSLLVGQTADGGLDANCYLLCTQPRCDSVRLSGKRMFPFQTVSVATAAKFNLVAAVPGPKGTVETARLLIGSKPHDTRMLEFAPTAGGRVQAIACPEGRFIFADVEGKGYVWIGDLRDLTAQRAASLVAARMHEVGLDEYEWLRIKAQ